MNQEKIYLSNTRGMGSSACSTVLLEEVSDISYKRRKVLKVNGLRKGMM
jgi:hypothetical protein